MPLRSKQSGVSDTGSEPKVFFLARLKLTAVYALILAIILVGFSGFLYVSVKSDISDSIDGEFSDGQAQTTFVDRTLKSVANDIVLVDIIILFMAGGLSYFLAGYTLRPIERSLEAQRAFSEHASHELRTPLAVMKNDVEVLLRNHSPTKELVRSTLQSNVEEIDRLSKMVADLLILARSQNRTLPAEEKVDIAAVSKNMGGKMQTLAANKGVSISVKGDTPLTVQGNLSAFERVLTNLLQNAIEHTHAGGIITIEIRREGTYAILAVSDTGSGIAEKDLPHVFERFYKGEGEPGSGLGLSIVKALLSQHGGSVEAASTGGTGTTITARLPLA